MASPGVTIAEEVLSLLVGRSVLDISTSSSELAGESADGSSCANDAGAGGRIEKVILADCVCQSRCIAPQRCNLRLEDHEALISARATSGSSRARCFFGNSLKLKVAPHKPRFVSTHGATRACVSWTRQDHSMRHIPRHSSKIPFITQGKPFRASPGWGGLFTTGTKGRYIAPRLAELPISRHSFVSSVPGVR